jgi:hypothetical protein
MRIVKKFTRGKLFYGFAYRKANHGLLACGYGFGYREAKPLPSGLWLWLFGCQTMVL